MIDIIELVIFSVSLLLIAYLSVLVFRLRSKVIKLTEKLVQNNIDKNTLFEKFAELKAEQDAKNIAETEGFLKFLSESRQMAFDYIELVQTTIIDTTKVIDEEFENSKQYGNSEYKESIKRIMMAYEPLRLLLPKGEKD